MHNQSWVLHVWDEQQNKGWNGLRGRAGAVEAYLLRTRRSRTKEAQVPKENLR